MDLPGRAELEIIGSDGSLFLPDPWKADGRGSNCAAATPSRSRSRRTQNPYGCELADFAAAARGERPPLLGRADAVAQARVIAALYESAERHAEVEPG